ncbi:Zn-ribbon domain-containing OB-fold protein [Nonomuraea sp. NPDC050556]|uniref:Zn-ribbon domain-containing OB-fold protein n=1 Tax=Nonomuraea sp. NPDC050556 TaxID=3364369 RepID=UPI0037883BB5
MLILQYCTACARPQHYPRALCTSCGATEFTWLEASGGGVVDSYTVVHRAPSADFETPYVIARVRLDEGPILLTRLVSADKAAEWACDERVRLTWSGGLAVFEKEQ